MLYINIEILTDIEKEAFWQSVTQVNSVKGKIEVSSTVALVTRVLLIMTENLYQYVQRVRKAVIKKRKKGHRV